MPPYQRYNLTFPVLLLALAACSPATAMIEEDTGYAGDTGDTPVYTGSPDVDDDGDGTTEREGDCDDDNFFIGPYAPDNVGDGIDNNCDGVDGEDLDGDTYASMPSGGNDCDDNLDFVYPGAPDEWYDGIDADCAGDNDFDADLDGFDSADHGGDDCNDGDDSFYPGAEDPFDGEDQDCGGDYDNIEFNARYSAGGQPAGDRWLFEVFPKNAWDTFYTFYEGVEEEYDATNDGEVIVWGVDNPALYVGMDLDITTVTFMAVSNVGICYAWGPDAATEYPNCIQYEPDEAY